MRTGSRLLAAMGLGAAALCATASPAGAHTDLIGSVPAAGAQLADRPEAVTLTFAEPIDSRFAAVTVTAADGSTWTAGTAASVDGVTVTQSLRTLADGTYTAAYRVVAADGHPLSGAVEFDVDAPPAPAAAAEAPRAESETVVRVEPAAAVTSEPGDTAPVAPFVGITALVLLVAGGAVSARRRAAPSVPSPDGSR